MKRVTVFLFVMIMFGCNQDYKKDDLIGIWEAVSVTDLQTGEVGLPEVDFDRLIVNVKLDSIYESEGDAYSWQIRGDSILVSWFSFYIKDVSPKYLTVVHYPFWGEGDERQEIKFKKLE